MREILVYADWKGLPGPLVMGVLRAEVIRGSEVFSFEYSQDWLSSGYAQSIDPDLHMYKGPQYLADGKSNFGLFLDSSPDRWGRMLMKRREAIKARKEGAAPVRLLESDYLLGVNDETRMGALRFKWEESGDFLETQEGVKIPPITSIRELEYASNRIEDDDFFDHNESNKWLQLIMAPGSSLGGARPKASVKDTKGNLWIAKFPSKHDDRDSGVWELLANCVASKIGIRVAEAKASKYSERHTFLTKRFDRLGGNQRIHFASAMTLLGYKDGHSHREGGSYLELIELIERYGARPDEDIRELWRRIVYSVGVSNTDDHLRNHGFLLSARGWILSPAFDINPNEEGLGLSLNITEEDNSLSYELCLEVAEYFRWAISDAKEFVRLTQKEISKWNIVAKDLGISKREISQLEGAFRW